jgi:hypothetical protein
MLTDGVTTRFVSEAAFCTAELVKLFHLLATNLCIYVIKRLQFQSYINFDMEKLPTDGWPE